MSDHSNRVQIGPEIDKDIWEQFRESTRERHGTVRGNLGAELENAIRFYEQYGPGGSLPNQLAEMQAQLDRIERATDATTTDGGQTLSEPAHTHTRDLPTPVEKPAPNTSTEKKVAWLAECVLDEEVPNSRDIDQVPRSTLRDVVKDEYGFRSDTARRYVGELIEYFDLGDHPDNDKILVTDEKRQRILDARRDEKESDAAETLDTLDNAEVEV